MLRAWSAGVFGATLLLYLATRQHGVFGDGVYFVDMLADGAWGYYHLLYLPLAQGVWLATGGEPEQALKTLAAIAGAVAATMAFRIALLVFDRLRPALAATAIAAWLPAAWFHSCVSELHSLHAACALLLLWGLLAALRQADRVPVGVRFAIGIGVLLALASHLSGWASVLPIGVVAWRLEGRARRQLLLAAAAGFAAFLVLNSALQATLPGVAQQAGIHYNFEKALFAWPGRLTSLFVGGAEEMLMYALPASTLVPAGLRVMFRERRSWGWTMLAWLVAWPLIAFSVRDFETAVGAYQTQALAVQAILAVVAFRVLVGDARQAAFTLLLAGAPSVALLIGSPAAGLIAWLPCAGLLLWMARPRAAFERAGLLLLLPSLTLLLAVPYLWPRLQDDSIREQIVATKALIGPEDLLVFSTSSAGRHALWTRIFPELRDSRRGFNPHALRFLSGEDLPPPEVLAGQIERELRRQHAAGRRVWVIGDLAEQSHNPGVQQLMLFLREDCALVAYDGEVEDLYWIESIR